MRDLSVLIPARNEMFLQNTIDSVLQNREADTEVIVVLDGYWPVVPIPDNSRVHIIHHTESVGQRAATNEAARLSNAKYVMKLDAHCSVDKGFDVKLLSDMQYHYTMVPRMYNLHVFDWQCGKCGVRTYQGPTPTSCGSCDNKSDFKRIITFVPRLSRKTDFTRFDKDLHFQYWREYDNRPEAKTDIADVLGNLGACWLMDRNRYWELGGLDEAHGSWGQMGTEISCKTWLSGGRQVVNKKTWFSHMFRTQGGDFSWPYPITDKQIQTARQRSRDLWLNNTWDKAVYKLEWLINKFGPVPSWEQ